MKYITLPFIAGLIVFVSVKGCFYPTSYRAFIPKSLDSEYKEFERFSQQELGRVLYARPLTEIEKIVSIKMIFISKQINMALRAKI